VLERHAASFVVLGVWAVARLRATTAAAADPATEDVWLGIGGVDDPSPGALHHRPEEHRGRDGDRGDEI
jgi:hypothetical protein